MTQEEKLPRELIDEILSRVPPESLVRFRTVCKRWSALFDDKTFMKNHKAIFRFILVTESKIYSVSIDPKIEVDELTLDIPGLESQIPKQLVECNEFMLCGMDDGAVVWNPCLKQTRRIPIKPEVHQLSLEYHSIGYEYNSRTLEESGYMYKTFVSYWNYVIPVDYYKACYYVHDFASDEWKDLGGSDSEDEESTLHNSISVSLNGILYWIAFYDIDDSLYHLQNFDFSSEKFLKFCDLPCGVNNECDALVLKVFRGDRFSLLKQSHETKKVEVWVTKNKINYEDGGDVVWVSFMTLSIPNLPGLLQTESKCQPSYFINDKRLVVCSCDESGQAWIYILGENKVITKIKLDSVVDPWPLHCSYIPSLIPVPRGKREEVRTKKQKRRRV